LSDSWRWEYDPDHRQVTDGVPIITVHEVERLADQLVELADTGVDITDLGNGPRPGGLRRMDTTGGWFYFLAAPRDRLIVLVRSAVVRGAVTYRRAVRTYSHQTVLPIPRSATPHFAASASTSNRPRPHS
jgi:hypothetical protein